MNVLLLDDNPIETEVMRLRLSEVGVENVSCFNHASAAYQYLHKHDVDLILFDLDMPGEDGLSVLSELHSMNFQSAISILSGLNDEIIALAEKVAVMFGLNLVSSNIKPLGENQLTEVLNKAKKMKHISSPISSSQRQYPLEEITSGLKNNQFITHYQPQYSFKTEKLIGVEVLVRWNHPDDGLVFPDTFIPVLEHANCEYLLLEVVLHRVMEDIASLPDSIEVAVNISVNDLRQSGFVEGLLSRLKSYDVSPKRIKLEITEACVYELSPEMLKSIARLRMHGFGLSIDDFGVGHSNLTNLVTLPFTELKVDKSFVNNYLQSIKHRHALDLAVQLAKKLNMNIVVEGVEDVDEYRAMNALGVDVCQGYYTGKPKSLTQLFREKKDFHK